MITIDEFKKGEIRAGKILSAEAIEGSEKLLKLSVDFGLKPAAGSPELQVGPDALGEEKDIRQVISGIAKYFPAGEGLAGQTVLFCTNLEPRALMGLESQGMILALGEGETFSLVTVSDKIPPGSQVR